MPDKQLRFNNEVDERRPACEQPPLTLREYNIPADDAECASFLYAPDETPDEILRSAQDDTVSAPFVRFIEVCKTYRMGEVEIPALKNASFSVNRGEVCVVVGASGAGKTTLLNILGGMDTLTSGRVLVAGQDISCYNTRQLTTYRRYDIGFVFQFYNLIQNLTALENVEIATQLSKKPLDARQVLADVGLSERMNNFPAQLSGGEQQRVAIARALAKDPQLLLCDEPTGALDYNTGKQILRLLQDTSREKGMTIVIITHNQALCGMADRIIRVRNGAVYSEELNAHPQSIAEIEW